MNEENKEKNREAMMGNTLRLVHGALSKRLLTEEEQTIYDAVITTVRDGFKLNDSSDQILLNELAYRVAKLYVAQKAGAKEAMQAHTGRISTLQRQLGIRRDKRDGGPSEKVTPQQLIAQIILRVDSEKGKTSSTMIDVTPVAALEPAKPENNLE